MGSGGEELCGNGLGEVVVAGAEGGDAAVQDLEWKLVMLVELEALLVAESIAVSKEVRVRGADLGFVLQVSKLVLDAESGGLDLALKALRLDAGLEHDLRLVDTFQTFRSPRHGAPALQCREVDELGLAEAAVCALGGWLADGWATRENLQGLVLSLSLRGFDHLPAQLLQFSHLLFNFVRDHVLR